eukprot:SM000338S12944  [mRNA]  locus=s338:52576:53457:+ [translate_table: standard]
MGQPQGGQGTPQGETPGRFPLEAEEEEGRSPKEGAFGPSGPCQFFPGPWPLRESHFSFLALSSFWESHFFLFQRKFRVLERNVGQMANFLVQGTSLTLPTLRGSRHALTSRPRYGLEDAFQERARRHYSDYLRSDHLLPAAMTLSAAWVLASIPYLRT